jgi:hypothetical protein
MTNKRAKGSICIKTLTHPDLPQIRIIKHTDPRAAACMLQEEIPSIYESSDIS